MTTNKEFFEIWKAILKMKFSKVLSYNKSKWSLVLVGGIVLITTIVLPLVFVKKTNLKTKNSNIFNEKNIEQAEITSSIEKNPEKRVITGEESIKNPKIPIVLVEKENNSITTKTPKVIPKNNQQKIPIDSPKKDDKEVLKIKNISNSSMATSPDIDNKVTKSLISGEKRTEKPIPKPIEYLLSDEQNKKLKTLKSNLQEVLVDTTNLPSLDKFILLINKKIEQIERAKTFKDYLEIFKSNWNSFFSRYKIWKSSFLSKNELIASESDKNEWNKLYAKSLNLIRSAKEEPTNVVRNSLKDFYIYKLKEQIKLYEQHPYYLQPLKRLKKFLYYYQNNYDKYVDFQWGIDKNNDFSLSPDKYYSGNFKKILVNDEFIANWLKYYRRWNWIFVEKKDQIPKIEDKDISALQIDPKFKDNKIISDYLARQINFQPNSYFKLWNINEQNPEKVNDNDVKQKGLKIFSGDFNKEIAVSNEINRLNLSKVSFQKPTFKFKKDLFDNKEYQFLDWSSIKNFDYKKFYDYQKLVELKDKPKIGSHENYKIYNNLLFEKPNLFSDAKYKSIESELINPKRIRFNNLFSTYGQFTADGSENYSDEEIKKLKIDSWINPIPEYKRWFNHWKKVLPNIINKNWNDETKIKAVAYYIATNSLYLYFPVNVYYNYNGYGFYNPAQIFTNDPEIQCVGYSMNLAAALTILNIPVRIVSGPYLGDPQSTIVSGYHAWNEVKVDNRWKAIDLTNFDLFEGENPENPTYELRDDIDLFLERNSKYMNQFKLDLGSYETTLMFFKNPKEYEYLDLPDSI
ncbi:hypothetical protein NPA08_03165 [Mycoplasmopsis citelli]|uniref:transglutaminase domain-containing protein n=1 Tax=Mycoplasmopsis citelli TaxID=171281 RepID=UPI00211390E5|nr:transglutaminase domain-containing protein [Mycoplasmopsis citelli]UUD35933.1 hypothetical protein NPA08_03165 [Mycoplasmopsis citelli]